MAFLCVDCDGLAGSLQEDCRGEPDGTASDHCKFVRTRRKGFVGDLGAGAPGKRPAGTTMSVVVENAFVSDLLVGEVWASFAKGSQADGLFNDAVLRRANEGKLPELRVTGVWAWRAVVLGIVGGSGDTSAHAEAETQAGEAQEFPAFKVTRHLMARVSRACATTGTLTAGISTMLKLLLVACLLLSPSTLLANEVFKITPLEGAAYSSAATVDPMAALVFTKSYTGSGTDLGDAASGAFLDLKKDLESAGLSMESVVNVRGYLLSQKGEDMGDAMGKWSAAFSEAFADNELAPTRTSIGVTHLPGEATVALDVVLAAEPEVLGAMDRSWANDRIYSSSESPVSLRAARPYSSLLITSGVLADALPGEGNGFGSMEQQSVSVLSKLDAVLKAWGLGRSDLLFVRAMLSPSADEDGELATDFVGFEAGWESFWENASAGAPPVSVFSAPGFSSTGRIVEIEFYAVFPDAMGPFVSSEVGGETTLAWPAWREGSETSFLSRSVAIARDAKLTWFAGVIDRNETEIYGQAMQSLLTLESRMSEVGLDYPNVVQLRAYLNIQDSFRTEFGNWNKAYRRFFDHAKLNPEKPVRSAFPIEELPAGALVEIEALGVSY